MLCPPHSLDLVAPHLLPHLANAKQLEPLDRIMKRFPGLATVYGIEIPLGGDPGRDFLLAISREDRGHEILAGMDLPHTPAWEKVRSFAGEWSRGDFPFKAISHIWLEFDGDGEAGPSLFFAPEVTTDTPELHYPLLERGCRVLLGSGYESILHMYRQARENLPPVSRIRHIGVMLPRTTGALRIVCDNFPVRSLNEYLSKIGWKGNRRKLEEVVDQFLFDVEFVFLNLDLTDGPGPEIGLEVTFDRKNTGSSWDRFLDRLEKNHICQSSLRQDLEKWSVPRGILMEGSSALWRFLNHVKLVLRQDESLDAKAYVGFTMGKKPPD